MKTYRTRFRPKSGFTLLEMTVSMAMLAMLATSCMVLVRTSYATWNRHHQDSQQRQTIAALMRHIERKIRQAKGVQSISPYTETSGSLSLLMPTGETLVWQHDATTKEVRYGVDTATEVLATGIESLTFYGFTAPFTLTTDGSLVHTILAFATINIARPAGTTTESWYGSAHMQSW